MYPGWSARDNYAVHKKRRKRKVKQGGSGGGSGSGSEQRNDSSDDRGMLWHSERVGLFVWV